MAPTDKRILWIDMARGLCMMAILFFHTECYYEGQETIPYVAYVGNALITFFFISGYVFTRSATALSVKRKLRSIVSGLVVPYLIFTSVFAFPKTLVHEDFSLGDAFLDIITGHATWFVPALIVTQLLFILLFETGKRHERWWPFCCALPFIIIALLYHTIDADLLHSCNLWCWQNAFLMLFFFYLGYIARREEGIMTLLRRNSVLAALLVMVVVMKIMEWRLGISLTIEPIQVTSFTLLLVDGVLFSLLICAICLRLPAIPPVAWTGANSLYYYFICGAVPHLVSKALNWCHLPYEGRFWTVILAFIIVYAVATATVWVLNLHKRIKVGLSSQKQ